MLVPRRGLEPPRCYPPGPEPGASTNSAIWAWRIQQSQARNFTKEDTIFVKQNQDPAARGPALGTRSRQVRASPAQPRDDPPDAGPRRACPSPRTRLATAARHRARRARRASSAASAPWSATARCMRNRRGAILRRGQARPDQGPGQGHPDGFGFLMPDDGGDDLFLGPKQMHKVLHGDSVLARVTGVDRRGRREGSIVEVLERANTRVVGRLFIEHGVAVRRRREPAHQPGHPRAARTAPKGAKHGPGGDGRDHRAADASNAADRRASSRCSATTPTPAWRSRSRCASTTCRTSSPPDALKPASEACRTRCRRRT